MSNLVHDPASLNHVLSMLAANDTESIKQGEELLKPFLKLSGSIAALMNQVVSNPSLPVKIQSALLIKKSIAKLYPKFPENDKRTIRSQLFELLMNFQEKTLSIAIAGAIAAVTKPIFTKEKV